MKIFNKSKAFVSLVIAVLCLTSCSVTQKKQIQPNNDTPRKFVIFFDGTANNEKSDTNIKKLHSLITLQNRTDITSIYIDGVGVGIGVIGMATGWGISDRVKIAYSFLLDNYHQGDEIFIFGFSRGAYSGRILASLLYYAGIPNIEATKKLRSSDVARIIYKSFKGKKSSIERRYAIQRTFLDNGLPTPTPVSVNVLGLWDTVEALGFPDYEANIEIPNPKYGDQLCNVKRAYHAVSIDDDRERIFTPILLTRPHLVLDCDLKSMTRAQYLDEVVDEVWFPGAHADVGGGYPNSLLSGVSLNWMVNKLSGTNLIPKNASLSENRFEPTHDPENGFPWSILYRKQSRELHKYTETGIYNERDSIKRLKLHRSMIERLEIAKPNDHEYSWLKSNAYPNCFIETHKGYHYREDSNCFDIVD